MVIQGARSNERRMRAIGFPTYRYRLTCFVIAGVMCGLAGILLANHTDFVSPGDDALDPLRRPDRDGGAGRHGLGARSGDRRGRAAGAGGDAAGISLRVVGQVHHRQATVVAAKEYWALMLGPMLLLVVLFARGGIDGLLEKIRRD